MEYQIWVENDPHARSWRTIRSQESVDMMRRLKIIEGDRIIDQAGFDNCLACHNSTRRYDEPRWTPMPGSSQVNSYLREGVGCSGCHGPSERWIDTHFQYQWSPQTAASDGFVQAGDLYVRARMCASCHVGDKDRDMNHDIIAAGHPTLRYELATFHAWLPKHWRDVEATDKTAYEARLWLAGQIASTDAALALLESRAGSSHSVSRWPELAAYNCASCHHNLDLENSRETFVGGRRASAIYSQWHDAGLRWLLEYRVTNGEATAEDRRLTAALDTVKRKMETRPRPEAGAVALAAGKARRALAAWFDGAAGTQERWTFRSRRLGLVVADAAGKQATFASWESAVQFYLAAVAARESWPGGWDGPPRNVADRMQEGLAYPQMIDVSRFAKRAKGKGSSITRTQAMALGVELARPLGPVQIEQRTPVDDFDGRNVQAEIDTLLEQLAREWKAQGQDLPPKPAVDAAVQPKPGAPPKQVPTKTDEPRQSIEDLRKTIEELQSPDGQPDD